MMVRRSLLVFALALSVARCADQPTAVKAPAGPQFLKWAGATPEFSSRTSARTRRSGAMALTPPLSLDQYTVSFWAVRGEARSIQINYSSIDNDTHPFLVLTTTGPMFAPGIGEIAMGDSVLITVTVDTTKIGVRFEPTGLQFGTPSQLEISYGGAGGDLNGDGIADETDTQLEQQLLGLWYREGDSDPWTHLAASQSVEQKSFTYGLAHFSEYAVAALLEWAVQF